MGTDRRARAIRAISKVVESYRVEGRHLHTFHPHGAIIYDERIMSFKGRDKVSLTTIEGREIIPLMGGAYTMLGARAPGEENEITDTIRPF